MIFAINLSVFFLLLFFFNSGHSKSLYGLGFLVNVKEKVIEIL